MPKTMSLDNTVASVFEGTLNSADYNRTWVMYEYDASANRYLTLNSNSQLHQGRDYWLKQFTGGDVSFNQVGSATPTTNPAGCPSVEGCFEIELTAPTSGSSTTCNMIGHPFNFPMKWRDVRVVYNGLRVCTPAQESSANLLRDAFCHFDGSASLEPYQGYWLQLQSGVTNGSIKLLIPKGETSDSPTCI